MKGSSSKLALLGQKQGSIKLKDLSFELGLGEEETLVFLRQVFPAGIGAEIYQQDNECWVDIDASSIQYMLPLSPAEWIGLHQLLSEAKSLGKPMASLKRKVMECGPIKVVMELLGELEQWDHQVSVLHQQMAQTLDAAVADKKAVQITTNEDKNYTVYPCRVVHLEGNLSLIAEDYHDHCLTVVSLKDLTEIRQGSFSGSSKVSNYEIEEFIAAIRAMNEKEMRLILKIHDPQSVNLFPDHHFLGKPCMVTNPNGDLIWAAYVEACEPLYEWLLSLGSHAEILDPSKFKDEYLSYCEAKIRKIA